MRQGAVRSAQAPGHGPGPGGPRPGPGYSTLHSAFRLQTVKLPPHATVSTLQSLHTSTSAREAGQSERAKSKERPAARSSSLRSSSGGTSGFRFSCGACVLRGRVRARTRTRTRTMSYGKELQVPKPRQPPLRFTEIHTSRLEGLAHARETLPRGLRLRLSAAMGVLAGRLGWSALGLRPALLPP